MRARGHNHYILSGADGLAAHQRRKRTFGRTHLAPTRGCYGTDVLVDAIPHRVQAEVL